MMTKQLARAAAAAAAALFLVSAPVSAAPITSGTLQQLSPSFIDFVEGIDFVTFSDFGTTPPAEGSASAFLQDVGGGLGDYTSFTPGNIALIERGGFLFSDKINSAFASGASGVLIYNNMPDPLGSFALVDPTSIPALVITQELGLALQGRLASGAVAMYMEVAAVPEPATLLLLGLGAIAARRRMRKRD